MTVIPTPTLHKQALHFAGRIGQRKVYDGQYLALADRENAPFWKATNAWPPMPSRPA